MRLRAWAVFLVALVGTSTGTTIGASEPANAAAGAIVNDSGCTTYSAGRYDDTPPGGTLTVANSSTGLNFDIDWYGTTYDSFAVNTNGGIQFGVTGWNQYSGLNLAAVDNKPLIAAGFTDLDTRNSSTSPMTYGPLANTFLGYDGYCINWLNIGDYSNGAPSKSFQLLILDVSPSNGDVILVMNYGYMNSGFRNVITGWAAPGGQGYIFSNPLPASGSSAQLGTAAGSLAAESFAPSGISTVPGRYIFEITGGAPAEAPGAPEPPTSLVATTTGSGTASLSFTASTTTGVTNYTFQYREGSGTWQNVASGNLTRASNTATEVLFSGLTDGTSYTFRATAFKSVSSSPSEASNPVIPTAAPVVATTSSSQSSGIVTVAGNVTSAGGATVTERGIVYASTSSPTTSDTKIASGSGTGTFSASTGTLSPGTYYFRAFATNTNGTAYGSEETVIIKGNQVISWSPSTSLTLAQSGLTLSASLTTGDGTLGYTVVSQGTTGCSASGSTLTFTSIGSGANGCEVRPTATSTTLFNEKSDAATVTFDVSRGTFAITSPSSKVDTGSTSFTDVCTSSCDVTGFAATDDIRVVVSKSDGSALSGRVKLGSTSGLTQSLSGYQADATSATGFAELAFEGTQAQVNAALETLAYKSPSGGGDETIGISASLAGAAYFSGTGHYYEVISGDNKTHAQAITAAASRTFNGLNGYLATILTEEENRFIDGKIADRSVWIGGKYNGTEWEWITGPIGGQVSFWTGTNPGSAISGVYAEWEPGQPDGSDVCLSTNYDGGDADSLGNWDDLTCTASKKWVVEYGGNGGTVLKQASTTFDVGAPTAPLQVSGVSVSAGNAQLTVSWSAPGTGGSAITDYVIEQSNDGGTSWTTLTDGTSTSTSYTVTGLTNGSSYSFRVSAKNAIGTGTASTSAVGTPVAPASTTTRTTTPTVVVPPVVIPAVPPRVTTPPGIAVPVVQSGPVLTRGVVPVPPKAPTVVLGGRPTLMSVTVPTTTQLDVNAGRLSLGVKVLEDQGTISEAPDGTTQIAVKKGASATISGAGFKPAATVQVFLPLEGDNAKELARIPVAADGSFDGSAPFATRPNEAPLPVGKQVLQLVSLDNDGNQVVVEMTVNIAQGAPAPEANRIEGVIPAMQPGQSIATSGGEPVPVTITPVSDQKLAVVEGDGWTMAVNVNSDQGGVEAAEGGALLKLVRNESALVSGSGFMAGTRADVWLFSDPTLLGTVTIDENGEFTGEVNIDPNMIPVGEHTLQLQGVGEDGYVKAANMGVLVDDPAEAVTDTATASLTFLWWIIAAVLVVLVLVVILASRRRRQA